jgi:hypothetical protein
LPSVLGEADASLASSFLMTMRTAVASLRFHSILPSVLTHQRTRSLFSAPVRKMRFFQTIGVELPLPGNGSFQATFIVALQVVGSPVSLEMPLLSGPRQLGQLSAWTGGVNQTKWTAAKKAKNADERFTLRFLLGNVP